MMSNVSSLEHLDEILLQLKKEKKSFYTYTLPYTDQEKQLVRQRSHNLGYKATFSDINDSTEVTLIKRPTKLNLDLQLSNETLEAFDSFATKTASQPMAKRTEMKTGNQEINLPKIEFNTGVCPPRISPDILNFEKYSTYPYRKAILKEIANNKVSIIVGKSGCGKTTQIPQYILEESEENPVNILCIEPSHFATAVAARSVAQQRDETVGYVVGYYLLMESYVSPQTCLQYATAEVFIQTLATSVSILEQINYLIIDEIHLRNRYVDFLLVCIKEYMDRHDNLKIILLSATPHVDNYMEYFGCTSMIDIPSRTYPVQEFFIDDVIKVTEYVSQEMHKRMLTFDKVVEDCMRFGQNAHFAELRNLVRSGDMDVNYYERQFGYTVLMVAAAHGIDDLVEEFICLGANVHAKCKRGHNAYTFATSNMQNRAASIIESAMLNNEEPSEYPHHKIMASVYKQTTSDNVIDYNLIVEIIQHIESNRWDKLSVLIFLPTYDYIIECYNFIAEYPISLELKLLTLHPDMLGDNGMFLDDEHPLFQPSDKRKVILATDVAQSSFQIKDVGYVIDSGRLKPSASLMPSIVFKWISQLSAVQRKARAAFQSDGRCYRLYSKQTYDMFNFANTAEMLDAPLQDMCLRAKLIITDMTISAFFNKAVDPPSSGDVKRAVKDLENLGLLDSEENLTIMGLQTVQIFIEPRIAKMLFYGVFLKCLDPILSIASVLVFKDPFAKSNDATTATIVQDMITQLSHGSCSDHIAMLFAYQAWQKMKYNNVYDNKQGKTWLNEGVMEDIIVIRANLLTQLRSTQFVMAGCRDNLPQLNKYSNSSAMVKAALAACLYPNVAIAMDDLYLTRNELFAVDRPSCLLENITSDVPLAYIYQEFYSSANLPKIKYVTAVSPVTIALFCGPRADYDINKKLIRLDKKITIHAHHDSVWKFRFRLHRFFNKFLSNPQLKCNSFDEDILNILHDVLNREEEHCNMAKPEGVGRRPVFCHLKSAEYIPPRLTDRYISDIAIIRGPNKFNKNFDIQAFVDENRKLNITNDKPQLTDDQNTGCEEEKNYFLPSTSSRDVLPSNLGNVNTIGQQHNMDPNELATITREYFRSLENDQAWGISVPESAKNDIEELDFGCWAVPKVRFFVIRPLEIRNILIAKTNRVWKFTAQTERKIFPALNNGVRVFLLYSIRGTVKFQGIAELRGTKSETGNLYVPINWIGTADVSFINIPKFFSFVHPNIEDGKEIPYHLGVTIFNMMVPMPSLTQRRRQEGH